MPTDQDNAPVTDPIPMGWFQFRDPTDHEMRIIQSALTHGGRLIWDITGHQVTDTEADLDLIQHIIDAGIIERDAELSWYALSHVLAHTFIACHLHYCTWALAYKGERHNWVVRYRQTRYAIFPTHLLELFITRGHHVDVRAHYFQAEKEFDSLERQHAPNILPPVQ
ncbi:MAG: DUF3806 domain-containing protein [Xanthomonadaceae bacterium]|jgi:hypothetical protein|nr:DUF3806 domain-containing protein [Xanthomonadaceae bacterium]